MSKIVSTGRLIFVFWYLFSFTLVLFNSSSLHISGFFAHFRVNNRTKSVTMVLEFFFVFQSFMYQFNRQKIVTNNDSIHIHLKIFNEIFKAFCVLRDVTRPVYLFQTHYKTFFSSFPDKSSRLGWVYQYIASRDLRKRPCVPEIVFLLYKEISRRTSNNVLRFPPTFQNLNQQ